MLDLQRQKYSSHQSSGAILFARKVIFAHLVGGVAIIALLLFHEFFRAAAWCGAWYVLTLVVCIAMMHRRPWVRIILAVLFIGAACAGFLGMVWIFPGIKPETPPLLTHQVLPVWAVIASLCYATGAYLMIVSQRIKRASEKGFTLLDTPDPY